MDVYQLSSFHIQEQIFGFLMLMPRSSLSWIKMTNQLDLFLTLVVKNVWLSELTKIYEVLSNLVKCEKPDSNGRDKEYDRLP